MTALARLTQSRLSLLLLDKATDALLHRVPVYAEISASVELPPWIVDQALSFTESETPVRQWLQKHPLLLDAIHKVIVANVAQVDFEAIADPHAFHLGILEKLRANLDDKAPPAEQKVLIEKIVLQALRKLQIEARVQPKRRAMWSHPLGTLASDHAGYLSFDLSHVLPRLKLMLQGADPADTEIGFFAYPLGREDLKSDLLEHARLTPDAIFAKLPIELPADFDRFRRVNLPAMHVPGLEDWYLSPGSFAINPEFFIGVDGCENLFPANFATHEFSFFQVVRGSRIMIAPTTKDDGERHVNKVLEVRTGWSLEYRVTWQPLGHTIGQIVYSLPLAPGEIVKVAVIDWARKSTDSRTEDLTVKEQLAHNTHRDRNISETVDAAMQEWQRGGSFMGGVAGSYGGSGFGISGAMGGGYSTSSGDRNVHAATVQQISDAFAQASSSVRELRSTIVVQSDQQEHAKAETRVVANHNHSHALTMLYYEVLRHYKVSTQFMRLRPSLLVQYANIDFRSVDNILRYRRILESVLIDGRYLGFFDAVQKLQCLTQGFKQKQARLALLPNLAGANELGEIRLTIKTVKSADQGVTMSILTKNLESVDCQVVSPGWDPVMKFTVNDRMLPDQVDNLDPGTLASPKNYRQDGQSNVFTIKPYKPVLWDDVDGLLIKVFASAHSWDIDTLQATTIVGDKTWVLIDEKQAFSVPAMGQKRLPASNYRELPADPAALLTDDEACAIDRLMNHLSDNARHYEKSIWLQEDPDERAQRFQSMLSGTDALIDLIENRPIDVLGDCVVFPARRFFENSEELEALEPVKLEKMMSLPTRGVFAEAKLGHCNASEEIDDTKFWDWQTSPITEDAPGITEVDINASRNDKAALVPSTLPSAIVNIVSPGALPDPTGMSGALNLLGKADIFRDMSVSKQVEALLEKLADKSVGISEASSKARDIQQQRQTSPPAGGGGQPVAPEPTKTPAQAQQEIKVSENQAGKGTITPAEHKENVKKAIDNMTGAAKGTPLTVTINFKHSISGPLDGEFGIEFIGPIGGSFFTNTVGGVGAGQVILQTGEQYTILIRGKRTRLPLSLDTVAQIPAVAGNPAFSVDLSNHVTKREVPIEANIVATITKGRKRLNITVVAEEVAKDIKVSVKVTASGTLKADLEGELGLKLAGIDVGHVKAGAAVETTVGAEVSVELPIEYKRLTGTVTVPKNELEL